MYAKIENNAVVEWPIESLRVRFPQISFSNPVNDATLPDGVVPVVTGSLPQYNPTIQKPVLGGPELVSGQWVQQYRLEDFSAEELQQRNEVSAAQAREQRNRLLAESDWTQVADAPVDQAAWAAYRQALRDVTEQPGFPLSVDWPEQPGR